MKKFKEIREMSVGQWGFTPKINPLGNDAAVDEPEARLYDVSQQEAINKINAYIGTCVDKPVIHTDNVIREIHKKLSILGLQFMMIPTDSRSTDKGKIEEYNITFLGGRFGVLDNNYTIGKDDGISHRIGRHLVLEVNYELLTSGLTKLNIKLVPKPKTK